MDINARIVNARITAARRDPAEAGYDDGHRAGWVTTGRVVKVRKHADPRWVKNAEYRAAFERGFRAGRALAESLPVACR
jgi:hypothetical protein